MSKEGVDRSNMYLLQKIWPHMLAVISSHESARQTRQWSGFGFADSEDGGTTTGVTGDVTAVSMDVEKAGSSEIS
jgi:hypothetical protein